MNFYFLFIEKNLKKNGGKKLLKTINIQYIALSFNYINDRPIGFGWSKMVLWLKTTVADERGVNEGPIFIFENCH